MNFPGDVGMTQILFGPALFIMSCFVIGLIFIPALA